MLVRFRAPAAAGEYDADAMACTVVPVRARGGDEGRGGGALRVGLGKLRPTTGTVVLLHDDAARLFEIGFGTV